MNLSALKTNTDQASRPKVSVCVMTYKQKEYIGQCLQSLVEQVTSFDFEIIVADDCSNDETTEIVREYSRKYPDLIRPILHEKNVGVFKNYWSAHLFARGELVAHMDGDDYALPGKLAAQAEFLDRNPEVAMCGHLMLSDIGGSVFDKNKTEYPETSTVESFLVYGNFIPHSSVMYRSKLKLDPSQFDENMIDFQLHVARVQAGKVGFINKEFGVYRVLNTGMVSGYYRNARFFDCNFAAIEEIKKYSKNARLVRDALFSLCVVWMKNFIIANQFDLACYVYRSVGVGCLGLGRILILRAILIFSFPLKAVGRFKRRFLGV